MPYNARIYQVGKRELNSHLTRVSYDVTRDSGFFNHIICGMIKQSKTNFSILMWIMILSFMLQNISSEEEPLPVWPSIKSNLIQICQIYLIQYLKCLNQAIQILHSLIQILHIQFIRLLHGYKYS